MRESVPTGDSSLLGCDAVSAVGRVLPCVAKCRSAWVRLRVRVGILRPLLEPPISQIYVTSWAPELIIVTWRRERCLLFPGMEPRSCGL